MPPLSTVFSRIGPTTILIAITIGVAKVMKVDMAVMIDKANEARGAKQQAQKGHVPAEAAVVATDMPS